MSPKKDTQKSAKNTTSINKKFKVFTAEERVAMRERIQELKASARRGPRPDNADGESTVLAKIDQMPEPDRAMGKRLHAIIKASAPGLSPRLWYGMPAEAERRVPRLELLRALEEADDVAGLGISGHPVPESRRKAWRAGFDEGAMWPTAFALTELTAADEARIGALVKKAVRT